MTEKQEEKFFIKIIGYSGYSGYSGYRGWRARVGSGGLGWRLPICVGLMVTPLLYRLLCYIYIMCGVFGEGLPL